MSADLTNEELLKLVKERGLHCQESQAPQEVGFAAKLEKLDSQTKEQLSLARSVAFLPQSAKTALMDLAMSELLQQSK